MDEGFLAYQTEWARNTQKTKYKPKRLPVNITFGSKVYEVHDLNSLIDRACVRFAKRVLWEFASKKWIYSEVDKEFKDKRFVPQCELAAFEANYLQFVAIIASDKEVIFDPISDLFQLFTDDPEKFEGLYQAAIDVNPELPDLLKAEDTE